MEEKHAIRVLFFHHGKKFRLTFSSPPANKQTKLTS